MRPASAASSRSGGYVPKKLKQEATAAPEPAAESELPIARFYDPAVRAPDALHRTLQDMLGWSDAVLERRHDYIQVLFPLPEGSPFNAMAPVVDRATVDAFQSRAELRAQLRVAWIRMLNFYGFVVEGGDDSKDTRRAASEPRQVSPCGPTEPENACSPATGDDSDQKESRIGHAESSDAKPTSEGENAAPTSDSLGTEPKALSKPPLEVVPGPNAEQAFRTWVVSFDHNHLRITRILRSLRVLGLETEGRAFFLALRHLSNSSDRSLSQRSLMYWRRATTSPLWTAPDGTHCAWLRDWLLEREARGSAGENAEKHPERPLDGSAKPNRTRKGRLHKEQGNVAEEARSGSCAVPEQEDRPGEASNMA